MKFEEAFAKCTVEQFIDGHGPQTFDYPQKMWTYLSQDDDGRKAFEKVNKTTNKTFAQEHFEAFASEYERKWKVELHNREALLTLLEWRDMFDYPQPQKDLFNRQIRELVKAIRANTFPYPVLMLDWSKIKIDQPKPSQMHFAERD